VAKDVVEIEVAGKKVKVGKKDYFKWCPIHSENSGVLYKKGDIFKFLKKAPKEDGWEKIPEKKYKISHSLCDLQESPNLKWFKLEADGSLRSIDKVALFEITVRQGIHTFICIL
jgi:hypothetical protein